MLQKQISALNDYSAAKHKRNIGVLTDDGSHKSVLESLGAVSLGSIGVRSLADLPEQISALDYQKEMQNTKTNADIYFIPSPNIKRLSPQVLLRAVGGLFDTCYNERNRGETGYVPMQTTPSFQRFEASYRDMFPGKFMGLSK